jgi:virulence factor
MTMRVAIIGLGDIARKAYRPLLTAWEGVEILLCN